MDYLLKASGLVTILFLFYFLFLRNETFFKSIRGYFLTGLVIVLSIPLVEIPVYVEQVASQLETINYSTINLSMPIAEVKFFDWAQILSTIYFLGILLFSLKFFIQLISLGLLLSKHQLTKRNNQYFVETDKNISPFSFFNIIIYNKSQFSLDELEQIVNHEKVHAKQWHTLDTILSHILVIVLWFNPFVWLYKKAVQQNLEFLADSQALAQTENQQLYQFTLLKTCTNNYCAQLTNNFYNSFIKTRILMLQKNRSTGKSQWKYALILPLIGAFVFAFNTKTIAQEIEVTEVHEIEKDEKAIVEIITKDFTKEDLSSLKQRLKSHGINFSYSSLKYNDEEEIIKLSIKISNENGKSSGTWQREDQAIPNIKVGVIDDNVIASSGSSALHKNHYTYTIDEHDSDDQIHEGHKIKYEYKTIDHDGKSEQHEKHEIIEVKEGVLLIQENEDEDKIIVRSKIHDDEDEEHEVVIKHHIEIDGGSKKSPLIIINGKESTEKSLKKIDKHKIKTIHVQKGKSAKEKLGSKGKDDVIYVTTTETIHNDGNKIIIKGINTSLDSDKEPLIFIDGKEATQEDMDKLDKNKIGTIEVLKGKISAKKHGAKGKNGVIEITTKKE